MAAGGTWSISNIDVSALNDGTITYTATATNGAQNPATSSMTATKDTTAPVVALKSVTDPIGSASASNATASGTGEVGATISVTASDGTHDEHRGAQPPVAGDGTWSISNIDVSALTDGTITFTATATDAVGNSATATKTAR